MANDIGSLNAISKSFGFFLKFEFTKTLLKNFIAVNQSRVLV